MSLETIIFVLVLPILSLSAVLALLRLMKGPSLPDRVVALDLMITTGMGISTCYAIATDQPAFIDVAIVLALISFLGTVAFAYYFDKVGEVG
ncbi:MAG: cation:proton antiporter [Chloroflexaceae bacterium]|nr:cation:proton antiporter [Chloroflexaceae bacterium]